MSCFTLCETQSMLTYNNVFNFTEKRNSIEKPERPPKPDLILLTAEKPSQVQATSDSTDEDIAADTDKAG